MIGVLRTSIYVPLAAAQHNGTLSGQYLRFTVMQGLTPEFLSLASSLRYGSESRIAKRLTFRVNSLP
jgi:hypothetical protein